MDAEHKRRARWRALTGADWFTKALHTVERTKVQFVYVVSCYSFVEFVLNQP